MVIKLATGLVIELLCEQLLLLKCWTVVWLLNQKVNKKVQKQKTSKQTVSLCLVSKFFFLYSAIANRLS